MGIQEEKEGRRLIGNYMFSGNDEGVKGKFALGYRKENKMI